MSAAVVVVAYNRPRSLERLLASLARAEYEDGVEVPLVISIDLDGGEGWAEVLTLARGFEWRHGPLRVIEHGEHLGLLDHLRRCGRLSEEYGDVIILEDDLLVAPPFYRFATAALDAYRDDERIAGVCLYSLWFNGFTHEPFHPVDDGSDAFFLKLPYTQGLAFTAAQWRRLDGAFAGGRPAPHPDLHPSFLHFAEAEWFPAVARQLAVEGRYFAFPRVSQTAGSGDEGTHFESGTSWLQTVVPVRGRPHHFLPFDEALAVYDSFYELLPDRLRRLAPTLPAEAFDVDLNATKPAAALHEGLVLTSRPVREAVSAFPLEAMPPELNLLSPSPGGPISLARRQDLRWDAWAAVEARRRLHAYYWRRHRPSRRRTLGFWAARFIDSLPFGNQRPR
jgi:hypothetical protein